MANPYEIPFTPPDLSPAVAMFTAARNQRKANKRADQYAEMQALAMDRSYERESHAEARQKAEDERKHAIEAWTAMPTLMRAAQRSTGMANTNPYGVKFDESRDLPSNVEGPEMSPAAEEARFAPKPPAAPEFHTPAQPPQGSLLAGEEGPEFDPAAEAARQTPEGPQMAPSGYAGGGMDAFGDQERQRAADNMDAVGTGLQGDRVVKIDEPFVIDAKPDLTEGTPDVPLIARAAANTLNMAPGPEGKRRVFGSYQGNRFEVPETSDETGFGPKYDDYYRQLLDLGDGSAKDRLQALHIVAAEHKSDQVQAALSGRATNQIDFRNKNREDQQTFTQAENEKYKETHKGRMELVDEAGKFKVAASAPGLKADAANARDMSLLERAGAAIRQTGQFSKLAASDKTVRGVFTNIAAGSVPLQHADAQIQLARFFRQAQPTEGEMHMLYNNLGGTMDKWNQFVAKMESGDLSAEQMRQLKKSAAAVKREHDEDVHRFMNVSKARLGPGGGFDLMPDQAQKLYESMGAELGLENLPPLYSVEGGVTLGSGKRPTTSPRGTKQTEMDKIEAYLDSLGSK